MTKFLEYGKCLETGKLQNPLNTERGWKQENDKILCKNVTHAGHRLEEGYENANQYTNNINIVECYVRYENALKDYYKKQISQLNALIVLLLGSLSKGDRQKV